MSPDPDPSTAPVPAPDGRGLRIAYVSGPADVRRKYDEWSTGQEPEFFGSDYMKQFFDVTRDTGAQAFVVSWHGEQNYEFSAGPFTFLNMLPTASSGVGYHLQMVRWYLRLLPRLIRFRPDVAILTGHETYWWMLAPLRRIGAAFLPSHHSTLWPPLGEPKRSHRALLRAVRASVLRASPTIIAASGVIGRQIEAFLDGRGSRVVVHLPTYRRALFDGIEAPRHSEGPFRILFVGRVERNKGVFDMLEMMGDLEAHEPGRFRLDCCGDGTDLAALRDEVNRRGLFDAFRIHGNMTPKQLRPLIDASHVQVVPTRSDFPAGFEMTCSEAILCGRPLVTSRACPALEYVRPATLEVEPDDWRQYRDAMVALADDPALYEKLRSACSGLREQFFDPDRSWHAAVVTALRELRPALVPPWEAASGGVPS